MKNAFAISVGITALPMTAATRCEYCGGVASEDVDSGGGPGRTGED